MAEPRVPRRPRRLVVVADDLGRSSGVDEGIAEAHERGIVTSASLMAGGASFDGAVRLARAHEGLSVGIHVTLCDGRPASRPGGLPGLVDGDGRLERSPARAGLRYGLRWQRLRGPIESEVRAQFERLDEAGIRPTHADGHHHLHVHPALFGLVGRIAVERGARWIRVPSEDLASALAGGSPLEIPGRLAEWLTFEALARSNRRTARALGLDFAARVLGLSHTGRLDESFLLDALPRIPAGVTELFCHPDASTVPGRGEIAAVVSARVRDRLEEEGILLAGYRDPYGAVGVPPAGGAS